MAVKSFEKKENSQVELIMEVSKADFDLAIDKAYKTNVSKINVQGFRKGKAPKKMIEKIYGAGVFYDDAIEIIYPTEYTAAVKETGIEPVDRADVEILEIGENGVTIKATVTVKPEVTIGKYKGLKSDKVIQSVSDEEIAAELKKFQDRNSRIVTVERAAINGDTITLNYSGSVDGVKFDGGTAENQTLKLGSNQFIPGFEEQLVGKSAGDECDVAVTFPTEYHAPELAGKEAIFACKVLEVKETQVDEIDDEFAKDVSEFENLADFKADIARKLQEAKDKTSQNQLEDTLITNMLNNVTVDVPHCMIETEIDDIERDFDYRMQMQGMNMEMYLKYTNTTKEVFRKSFEEQADRRVKTRLALEKIVELEKIEVSESEIDEEYERLAAAYNIPVEQAKSFVGREGIGKDLAVAKAVELVKNEAKVTEISLADYQKQQEKESKKVAK